MSATSRGLATLLRTGYRCDPRRWLVYVGCIALWQAMPLLGALLVRQMIDGVLAGDDQRVRVAGVLLGLVGATTFVAARARSRTVHILIEKSTERYDRQIIAASVGIPTLTHLERPEYLDRVEQLRYQPQALGLNGLQSAVMVWGTLQALLVIALLVSVDPVLLLLPVLSAPSLWSIRKAEGMRQAAFERGSAERRVAGRFFELATEPRHADEVRLLRVGDDLLAHHDRLWAQADAASARAERRAALLAGVGRVLFSVSYLAAVLVVVERGLRGQATVGDVVLTVVVAGLLSQQVGVVLDAISRVLNALSMVGRFLWLMDQAAAAAPQDTTAPAPERLVDGITLEDVTFRYGPDAPAVLDGVTLHLPAGCVVAVVGDNGAGKTTLVKLLTGLYRPERGRILVDGTPLDRIDPEAWRRRCSAAFQDFARLELVLQESVGVGDLDRMHDPAAVTAAVHRAGAETLLDEVPGGLDTLLGTSFDGGVVLSGGQWQKVALARMLMRHRPVLVALDEPAASLDPAAEHELFDRYARHARSTGAGSGAITILVSHRLTTVRAADLIVVLGPGGPIEVGSHHELVDRGGVYAELYAMQAAHYR